VIHPRERDVWGEVVLLRVEAQIHSSSLDGFVECRQLLAALADAEPDDADVLEGGKDAESAKARLEGCDTTLLDGCFEFLDQVRDALVVGVTEKFECDVGLAGIDEIQSTRALEQLLYYLDLLGEAVEVDTDEQSLAHGAGFGRRE